MGIRGKIEWTAVPAWSTASGLRLTPFSAALDCSGFETGLQLRRSALWTSFLQRIHSDDNQEDG
jgi:hypothetical protein